MTLLRHHDWAYTLLNTTIGPDGRGLVIKVKWGETGFYPTRVAKMADQVEVDALNKERGIEPWEAEAMSTCSIFGNWAAYDDLSAKLKETMEKELS